MPPMPARFQFRLSTLLWITLGVACFFGGMRVEKERFNASERTSEEQFGGEVWRRFAYGNNTIRMNAAGSRRTNLDNGKSFRHPRTANYANDSPHAIPPALVVHPYGRGRRGLPSRAPDRPRGAGRCSPPVRFISRKRPHGSGRSYPATRRRVEHGLRFPSDRRPPMGHLASNARLGNNDSRGWPAYKIGNRRMAGE